MTVINESGLYSLILSSKLPKAAEIYNECIDIVKEQSADDRCDNDNNDF
jgi:prophage antirepressor-like protein